MFESYKHYFLDCKRFNIARMQMLADLKNIIVVDNYSDKKLMHTLIYGDN